MTDDCVAFIEIGGVEIQCRDYKYTANVLKLADKFSVTIPAPNGKVASIDGTSYDVLKIATMGDAVTFYLSDPEVQAGAKLPKLRGRVTGRNIRSDASGLVLSVTGADLAWHLTSCGRVFKSLRGLTWLQFASRLLGMTLNPTTGEVTSDPNQWGFSGFGNNNVFNRKIRLGRVSAEQAFREESFQQGLVIPRIQVEVGQTLDSLLVQYARLDGYLVNMSTDGWLQIFRPAWDGVTVDSAGKAKPYTAAPLYTFTHPGNVIAGSLSFDEDGGSLYSHLECWNTVIDTTDNDPTNQNAGRYHGTFDTAIGQIPFSFERRYTFSDAEQYGGDPTTGQSRVNARAKWQWQRFAFDAQTITFEVRGHSQGGVPFVEDTLCTFRSDVLGIDDVFYVSQVEPYKKLAGAGFDKNAGTRTKITLNRSGLLAA